MQKTRKKWNVVENASNGGRFIEKSHRWNENSCSTSLRWWNVYILLPIKAIQRLLWLFLPIFYGCHIFHNGFFIVSIASCTVLNIGLSSPTHAYTYHTVNGMNGIAIKYVQWLPFWLYCQIWGIWKFITALNMRYMLFTSSVEVVEMAKLPFFSSTSSSARNWLPIKSECWSTGFIVQSLCRICFFFSTPQFSADNVFCQF